MRDDELDAILRSLGGPTADPNAPLSLRAVQDLDRIVGGERVGRASRRHISPRWIALPVVAFAAIVATLIGQQVLPVGPAGIVDVAQAATPSLLEVSGPALDYEYVMSRALKKLGGVTAEPQRRTSYEAWYVTTTIDGGEQTYSYVSPQDITVNWNPDLSGQLSVVAAESLVPGGKVDLPVDPIPAGTVVQEDKFEAGQMGILFQEIPPTDPSSVVDYLAAGAGVADTGDAVQMMDAVGLLLNEWTLSPEQHSAIIQALASVNGIVSLGDVEDRLGRPGWAFTARSPSDARFEDVFVISKSTGQIASIEKVYLGGVEDYDFAAPAVVSYVAWK